MSSPMQFQIWAGFMITLNPINSNTHGDYFKVLMLNSMK